MIFQHTWEQVLKGNKWETRRLWKPGDQYAIWQNMGIAEVQRNGYRLWRVGGTYAVQPGRGQKAVGRIRLTGIRQEYLREMTEADFQAEGFHDEELIAVSVLGEVVQETITARSQFVDTWNTIHTKFGTRWQDNPQVWMLQFELTPPEEATP